MAGSLRGLTLFPLPISSTFIIWEKDRSGHYHWKEHGRFLQCLMEHSENHSNVSSSWWHPIALITYKTHEGMPLPSVNELLNCITPWKSRNKAITCDLSTFGRARLKTVLDTMSLMVLVRCWTWLSIESWQQQKKMLVLHQL